MRRCAKYDEIRFADEVHRGWMKSLRDEVPLRGVKKRALPRWQSSFLTGLVSRVLYALRRSNHLSSLTVTDKLKPCGSATSVMRAAPRAMPEIRGVASDRVYSGSMLP